MYALTWLIKGEGKISTQHISHRGTAVSNYWTLVLMEDEATHITLIDIENNLKYNPTTEEWEDM